ncbi:MAG: hypothetical protein AB1510_04590 [Bacillota bacterium]
MAENVYEREKLYKEVWAEPVTIVSKRYGVSNVALRKVCKRMNIPVPPRGYWAKLRAGGKMKKTPLPPHKGPKIIYGNRSEVSIIGTEKTADGGKAILTFFDEAERQKILDVCASIEISEQLRRPHSLIVEHRDEMALRKKRERERKRYDFYGSGLSYLSHRNKQEPDKHVLELRVSGDSMHRAYRLMDAFVRTLESLDCTVVVDGRDGNTYALVRSEKIRIIMKESDGLTLFLDDRYAKRRNFRDTKTRTLDSLLGDAIVELFETSERIRVAREDREREERRRQEEAERRYQRALRQQEEFERVAALENAATDWHTACIIREYIAAIEAGLHNEADEEKRLRMIEWLAWARDKADWFDPIVARNDPVLGRRRHAEPEGKKVDIKDPYTFLR